MKKTKDNLVLPKSKSWQMFDRISAKYDLLNHLLSFGLDIGWRRKIAKFLPQKPNMRVLDLATGTADVLLSMFKRVPAIEEGIGIDLSENMIAVGQAKVVRQGLSDKITLNHGDANQIPFTDTTFDVVTMAFGIRNVEDPQIVFDEMFRVLRPDGKAIILEFSLPSNKILRSIHLFYLKVIVPNIGGLISGDKKAYRYLNQTIETFPYGKEFCANMKEAGFGAVEAHLLLFGIATIYVAEKAQENEDNTN